MKLASLCLTLALAAATAWGANATIYPDPSHAKADIAAAIKTASATHKRILVDFGGDWCPDCKMLDIYFHDKTNGPIVAANFVVVHVNIGNEDTNLDVADKYHVPVKKGVPAMAVLDEHGKLLFAQQTGQFKDMSRMQSSSLTDFLVKWKPTKPGCSVVMASC